MLRKLFKTPLIFLLLALIIGASLRLILLDRLPTAIGNDELQYVLNARSFYQSGTDITGSINVFSPFLFHYPKGANPQAELPYLLLMYLVGPFSLSLLNARLLGAIMSTLTILLGYLIGKKLFNQRVGVITAFTFALNPWFIFIGRTAYEMAPAMFFYLLAFYVLLSTKKWHILLALPLFLLGFYSYIGTKLIFLPLIAVTCYYLWKVRRQDRTYYLTLSVVALLITLLTAYMLSHSSVSRISEILTPLSPQVASDVDGLRKITMANPLSGFFINKITIYFLQIVSKAMEVFSPSYLFLGGDLFFSLFRQGLFYLVDSVFLIWGLIALYKKQKREFYLVGFLALVGIIPQLLHTQRDNFTPHITMMIPFFLIIIAYGINSGSQAFKKKSQLSQTYSSLIIALVYILALGNFIVIYFFQFPLGGFFDFPTRILSHYTDQSANSQQQIVIVSAKKNDLIPEMMFYKNSSAELMKKIYTESQKKGPTTVGSLSFITCGEFKDVADSTKIFIVDSICGFSKSSQSALLIPGLKDGGGIYSIYNDTFCSQFLLQRYPQNITLNSFALNHLTEQQFCNTFITTSS